MGGEASPMVSRQEGGIQGGNLWLHPGGASYSLVTTRRLDGSTLSGAPILLFREGSHRGRVHPPAKRVRVVTSFEGSNPSPSASFRQRSCLKFEIRANIGFRLSGRLT